ncbi:hypothetical protein Amsp01_048540 [Amycolatopsis sp. NBRC 101858]|uniref:hypothetical protein n=1 Tax=Amycolatopsis sp. NBRC 101858 TaxID=3032200 RepID=UPI0024A4BB07|nr:hypothetical protein [Amycolatopsis sp. NBRC 101858]GLY38830.1 hypothetical protein Amsp01_048540 [Amycolatopsis sp. NBRC 101858]
MHSERGDDNVAAAAIFTAILLLAWAILQVAVVLLGRGVALEAARDGVHSARLPPVDTASAASAAAAYVGRATGSWLGNVAAHASNDGRSVSVTVSGDAVSLVPFARFPISQTSSGPIEELQP